jgi:hypothetical protein
VVDPIHEISYELPDAISWESLIICTIIDETDVNVEEHVSSFSQRISHSVGTDIVVSLCNFGMKYTIIPRYERHPKTKTTMGTHRHALITKFDDKTSSLLIYGIYVGTPTLHNEMPVLFSRDGTAIVYSHHIAKTRRQCKTKMCDSNGDGICCVILTEDETLRTHNDLIRHEPEQVEEEIKRMKYKRCVNATWTSGVFPKENDPSIVCLISERSTGMRLANKLLCYLLMALTTAQNEQTQRQNNAATTTTTITIPTPTPKRSTKFPTVNMWKCAKQFGLFSKMPSKKYAASAITGTFDFTDKVGRSEFLYGTACMVAYGICDPGSKRTLRIGYATMCDAISSLWGYTERSTVARISDGELPFIGPIEAYCLDYARGSIFFRMRDGKTYLQGSREWTVLDQVLKMSKHRNNLSLKESIVFAIRSTVGMILDGLKCMTCVVNDRACTNKRPIIFGGRCLVTSTDIKRITYISSTRNFDDSVCHGCIETDICGFFPMSYRHITKEPDMTTSGSSSTTTTILKKDIKEKEKKLIRIGTLWRNAVSRLQKPTNEIIEKKTEMFKKSRKTNTNDAVTKMETEILGNTRCYVEKIMLGEIKLRNIYGITAEDLLGCKPAVKDMFNVVENLLVTNRNLFLPITDDQKQGTDAVPFGMATNAEAAKRDTTNMLKNYPGIEDIKKAGWNMMCLRRYLPPCLGKIVDECYTVRHPSYVERMFIGNFMCQISGLATDEVGFYLTWSSLFKHPEKSCILYENLREFDDSKYGRTAAEDVVRYAMAGKKVWCPFAISKGSCPFLDRANKIETLRDIEDMRRKSGNEVGHTTDSLHMSEFIFSAQQKLEKAMIPKDLVVRDDETPEEAALKMLCKSSCMEYMKAIINNGIPNVATSKTGTQPLQHQYVPNRCFVSEPGYFYSELRRMLNASPQQIKK